MTAGLLTHQALAARQGEALPAPPQQGAQPQAERKQNPEKPFENEFGYSWQYAPQELLVAPGCYYLRTARGGIACTFAQGQNGEGGCKPGDASTTRTRRPACAISFAAYKPAAEPPTTTTCSVLVAAGLFSSLDTRPFCLNRPRDPIPASWEFLRRSAGSPRLLLQSVRPSDVALTELPA